MLISDFGIRLKEEDVWKLIVEHLDKLGYIVESDNISIVPLTSGKVEFIIRQFLKK